MYNDIFVAPKQKELEKLKKKEDDFRADDFITGSSMLSKARVEP